MFKHSYKIATVWGIPIKLHISLVLTVLWFSSELGLFYGTILTAGLLTSIVLHELGHSIVGIKKGCKVRQITLLALGGAAEMERMPSKPKDEILMALAGPGVSLVLGATLLYMGHIINIPPVHYYEWNIVQVLGGINITLLIFNLLPSFPMDGGRVFRAMLTPKLGRLKATFFAARVGQIICILAGIYAFSIGEWFLLAIAFFIFISAGNEYRMVQVEEARKSFNSGSNDWNPFGSNPFDNEANKDEVTISPPPYEKGPNSKTYLHIDDDDPVSKLFK